MHFTELVVVIPTRNRATLASNAIRSVLDRARPQPQFSIPTRARIRFAIAG